MSGAGVEGAAALSDEVVAMLWLQLGHATQRESVSWTKATLLLTMVVPCTLHLA